MDRQSGCCPCIVPSDSRRRHIHQRLDAVRGPLRWLPQLPDDPVDGVALGDVVGRRNEIERLATFSTTPPSASRRPEDRHPDSLASSATAGDADGIASRALSE